MSFTYHPTRVTVTPLGPDGKPTGPPVDLTHAVHTIDLNTTTQPKEQPMPDTPPTGWTKARIWDRYQQLLSDRDQLQADHDELGQQLADQDPEARTLGACVNALDAMLTGERDRADRDARQHGGYLMASSGHIEPLRPTALDSSVGRILLHLAARYGVDLVALPPEPPEPQPTIAEDGKKLMVVPEKLANSIQQLLEQLSMYDLDQLR